MADAERGIFDDNLGFYNALAKQIEQLRGALEKVLVRLNRLEKPGSNTVQDLLIEILLSVQEIGKRQVDDMAGQVEALEDIAAAIRETATNQITPEMMTTLDKIIATEKSNQAALEKGSK